MEIRYTSKIKQDEESRGNILVSTSFFELVFKVELGHRPNTVQFIEYDVETPILYCPCSKCLVPIVWTDVIVPYIDEFKGLS